MIFTLIILALLNGFSIGVFLFENHGKLTKQQWLIFTSMIFIGILVLIGFILLHKIIDYRHNQKAKKNKK
jgi:hypothetical protein